MAPLPPAVYRDLALEFYRVNYFHQRDHRSAAAERAVGAINAQIHEGLPMFDLDRSIADCSTAVRADRSHKSVRELVSRVVSDPTGVVAGLGEPRRAEVQRLYSAADLTILNVI